MLKCNKASIKNMVYAGVYLYFTVNIYFSTCQALSLTSQTTSQTKQISINVSFFCRYRMVYHPSDKNNRVNPYRYTLLVGAAERQRHDGLSNLKYSVVSEQDLPLYTNITADVGKPPLRSNISTFGTGVDIVVSLSLLLLMMSLTCCTCIKSRLMHLLLCPRRVP